MADRFWSAFERKELPKVAGPVKSCMTCDHWAGSARQPKIIGDCRIRAPTVVDMAPLFSSFPKIAGDGWCSEYKQYVATVVEEPTT